MRLNLFSFLVVLMLSAATAHAASVAKNAVPVGKMVGSGVLSYVFWDIYKASLYAPDGKWQPQKPYALSIKYFHTIKGNDIADRSIQEMRNQGFTDEIALAAWHTQLKDIFPDVTNGTVLSAVYVPGKETRFYKGDTVIGSVKGDAFSKAFFGIWLDERTSEPELRRALLGMQ